jgi:hypothetical protein
VTAIRRKELERYFADTPIRRFADTTIKGGPMAVKRYRALVTGTHALTDKYIEAGQEYDVEESMAGPEVFEEIRPVTASGSDGVTASKAPTRRPADTTEKEE